MFKLVHYEACRVDTLLEYFLVDKTIEKMHVSYVAQHSQLIVWICDFSLKCFDIEDVWTFREELGCKLGKLAICHR